MQEIRMLLQKKAEVIDNTLSEVMEIEENAISKRLVDSMKYTIFCGGKRIRPFLTLETAKMVNGNMQAAHRAGAAVELIHTYSLIHDDLPSMDDDEYRRGKLTNHRVYGPALAILAGDGLLTYAFKILGNLPLAAEKKIKIINLISDGAGYNGMVGGQALDLAAEGDDLCLEELENIHRAKTGALFKSSVLAGAYSGSPAPGEIEALSLYAEYLGLTFQIVDDILDVTGDEEKLGKKVGSDQKQNKTTYPSLLGLKEAKKRANNYARKAKEELELFGKKAKLLAELMDFIVDRET